MKGRRSRLPKDVLDALRITWYYSEFGWSSRDSNINVELGRARRKLEELLLGLIKKYPEIDDVNQKIIDEMVKGP